VRAHLATLEAVRDREDFKFELHATTRVDALISLLLEGHLPDDPSARSFTMSALSPSEATATVIDARCALRYAQSYVFGFEPGESAALELLVRIAEALLAAARERRPSWRPERTMPVPGITKQMIGFHPERAKFLLHALPHTSEAAVPVEAFAHILRWARETPLTPEGHLAALREDRERASAFPDGPANLLAERLHVSRTFPPEQVEAVEQLGKLVNLYLEAFD
ncbi:MAG: hypothetical protein P8Y02_06480, partial [Deinococcales bacterium]